LTVTVGESGAISFLLRPDMAGQLSVALQKLGRLQV